MWSIFPIFLSGFLYLFTLSPLSSHWFLRFGANPSTITPLSIKQVRGLIIPSLWKHLCRWTGARCTMQLLVQTISLQVSRENEGEIRPTNTQWVLRPYIYYLKLWSFMDLCKLTLGICEFGQFKPPKEKWVTYLKCIILRHSKWNHLALNFLTSFYSSATPVHSFH